MIETKLNSPLFEIEISNEDNIIETIAINANHILLIKKTFGTLEYRTHYKIIIQSIGATLHEFGFFNKNKFNETFESLVNLWNLNLSRNHYEKRS